jgi:hypothetical protein
MRESPCYCPEFNDLIDGTLCLSAAFVDAEYRCVFACHL